MAGLTRQGFEVKRLPQIINDLKSQAIPIFQDLLEDPNDHVDTSEDSTLGRFIGLLSPALVDLWEASQDVYFAFDPNSAEGIALDNLVAFSGITRMGATHSTAYVRMTGDLNTQILSGNVVEHPVSGNKWTTSTLRNLTIEGACGIGIEVETQEASTYSITITDGGTTTTVSYTSSGVDSDVAILEALKDALLIENTDYESRLESGVLFTQHADMFAKGGWSVTPNLKIVKVCVLAEVVSQNTGAVEADSNTITKIATPVLGWDSVTNPVPAVVGRGVETDEELRERFRVSKHSRASNLLESMYSALLDVDGVVQVRIYENDTSVVDDIGLPPHSFLPIVVGGGSEDIALAVWRNKPIGILSNGNTEVDIRDAHGFLQKVKFSRPTPVDVKIHIKIVKDVTFPQDGEGLIKTNLIQYFRESFGVGDDVIYSRLLTPINRVQGFYVDELNIGIGSADNKSNLVINFDEIASLSLNDIVVEDA